MRETNRHDPIERQAHLGPIGQRPAHCIGRGKVRTVFGQRDGEFELHPHDHRVSDGVHDQADAKVGKRVLDHEPFDAGGETARLEAYHDHQREIGEATGQAQNVFAGVARDELCIFARIINELRCVMMRRIVGHSSTIQTRK